MRKVLFNFQIKKSNFLLKNHSGVVQVLIDNGARLEILNNEKKSAHDLTLDAQCKVLTEFKGKKLIPHL